MANVTLNIHDLETKTAIYPKRQSLPKKESSEPKLIKPKEVKKDG